ncbi:CidA/LrgA family protein [Enterococcus gallinarum]|uniref:CidA/LrgA family protein n=1 Tax=Enterococcus gallinarum TaxID=1353 RepID=UPI0022E7FF35|nr:CidA/LrgA family protein [Enterococcus gallinarum]
MKALKQFIVIIFITALAEFVSSIIPVGIPSSIWGLGILFFLLKFEVLKLEKINDISCFLLDITPILFIPISVRIIEDWIHLKNSLIQLLIIIMVSTLLCLIFTSKISEHLLLKKKKEDD